MEEGQPLAQVLGLQPLLDVLRDIHRQDMQVREQQHQQVMQARDRQHQEEMRAQKEAQETGRVAQQKAFAEQLDTQMRAHQLALEAQEKASKTTLDALLAHMPKPVTPTPPPAAGVPSFAAFDSTSELWRDYLVRFETFIDANSISAGKSTQVFLTSQSPTIFKLLDTLAERLTPPVRANDLSMKQIRGFMEEQFDPKQFAVQERYKLWTLKKRQPGESLNDLAARIRRAVATCDFASVKDWVDDTMRTAFVCKVDNEAIVRACFQRKPDDLTFSKAVALAIEIEEADKAARWTTCVDGAASTPVYKVSPVRKSKGEKLSSPKRECGRCGKTGHFAKDCKFLKAQCYYCRKRGHLASVCLQRKRDRKEKVGVIVAKKPVQRINSVPGTNPARLALEIDGKTLVFEADSGARDSFCSTQTWTNWVSLPCRLFLHSM